jgi:hypothetical protein
MSDIHSIRLHGPWEIRLLPVPVAVPVRQRIQMPDGWNSLELPAETTECRLLRGFNSPTGLGPGTDVWLVFEVSHWDATLLLNQTKLGRIAPAPAPQRFLVTDLLQPRNEIEVQLKLRDSGEVVSSKIGLAVDRNVNQAAISKYRVERIGLEISRSRSFPSQQD